MIAVPAVVVLVSALSCNTSCYTLEAVPVTGIGCSCYQARNAVPGSTFGKEGPQVTLEVPNSIDIVLKVVSVPAAPVRERRVPRKLPRRIREHAVQTASLRCRFCDSRH